MDFGSQKSKALAAGGGNSFRNFSNEFGCMESWKGSNSHRHRYVSSLVHSQIKKKQAASDRGNFPGKMVCFGVYAADCKEFKSTKT